jgi:DNA (cytosine-5)-methyltransferase 1
VDSATLNTISLCSGVGMLDEGVHAGLEFMGIRGRTVMFAEREAYPASILAARMEEGSLDAAPIWFGDFTELPARRFRGLVDGIVAGFPCQDLSVAGRRAGLDGKRSGLFFNVLDIADDSCAWFLVLENVAGISSATASVVDEASTADYAAKPDGSGFSDVGIEDGMLFERACSRVMGELADRGWNAEWITLSASDVGASHGRARWFCFAWRVADAGLQHRDIQQWRARPEHQRSRVVMGDAELSKRRAQRVSGARGEQGNDGGRPEAHGGAGIADQALGNAERARRTQAGCGLIIDAGCEPESGCGAVADADTEPARRHGGSARCEKNEVHGQDACDGDGSRNAGIAMANTSGPRLQGFQRSGGGF